jgi:hypothetical protein
LQNAYKVVKFMVKVKLIEKRVKSRVGRVMVVNVMIQYRAPGKTPKTVRTTREIRPRVERDVLLPPSRAATEVCSASVMFERAWLELLATELTAWAAIASDFYGGPLTNAADGRMWEWEG